MADNAPAAAPAAPRINAANAKSYAEIEKKAEAEVAAAMKKNAAKHKVAAPKPPRGAGPRASGFDPMRPVRYLRGFIGGTIGDTLEGIARGGRVGVTLGIVGGILGVIGVGMGAAPLMMMGVPIVTALGGIVMGGTLGLATGGVRGVMAEKRRENGNEPVAAKPTPARPTHTPSHAGLFQEYEETQKTNSDVTFDRAAQQQRENATDYSSYWQDRINAEGPHHGGWRGF